MKKTLIFLPLISLSLLASCGSNQPKLTLGNYYVASDDGYYNKTAFVLDKNKSYSREELLGAGMYVLDSYPLCSINKSKISLSILTTSDGGNTYYFSSPSNIYLYECLSDKIISVSSGKIIAQFKEGFMYFQESKIFVTESYAKNNDYKIVRL